jgi:hypothetical protein
MTDTFFEQYKNCDLNIIPVIEGNTKKVYILTGPHENGVIIFGNDYELIFDKNDNLKFKRRIHKNILIERASKEQKTVAGIHTHLASTGDLITSTDICTLMLYAKSFGMQNYYVLSEEYVSLWDCEKNKLNIITRKAWDKIYKSTEKK